MSVPQNAEESNKTIPNKCFVNVAKFQTFGKAKGKFKNPLSSSLLPSNTNIELCEMFVVTDL
jgi:hypothetical protein